MHKLTVIESEKFDSNNTPRNKIQTEQVVKERSMNGFVASNHASEERPYGGAISPFKISALKPDNSQVLVNIRTG